MSCAQQAELNIKVLVEFLMLNSIYLKKSVPPDAEKVNLEDLDKNTLIPPPF